MAMLEATANAFSPITQEEIHFDLPPEESGALKILLADFSKCESWLSTKQWALRWRESQLRYEPIRLINYWENTSVPRSSLNVYTVAQIVQSINAKVMEGLFSDDPPFVVQPRKGTQSEEARAISALLNYQLEDCCFRQEIENGSADAILFGTAIWKANWEEIKRKYLTYQRKAQPNKLPSLVPGGEPIELHTEESDEIIQVPIEIDYGRPVLELQDLYETYVDPNCKQSDIRKAKYVISRVTVSADELDRMRNWEGYDIPSQEKLMDLLFPKQEQASPTQLETQETIGNNAATHQAQPQFIPNTSDPLADTSRFEILERWDNNTVIAVLNRKLVIRNEENPWGRLPYFSVGWWRVPDSFYSMGVGITAGDEQEIQRGLINSMLDEVSWNLNLPILVAKGEDNLNQNIRMSLGKFIRVDDPARSMKQMERLQAVPEGYAEIQASEARAEASTGANELLVQGSMPSQGRTSLGRTATGANLLAGGAGGRLEAFVDRLAHQVMIPAMDMFFEMDKQLLDMGLLRDILDNEMMEAYEGDHINILNARVRFDVLAASKMVARQRMAQALPMLMQAVLTDPMHSMLTQQNKKVDVNELINMYFDVIGWKNKSALVLDMTPEDQQRAAASNPAVVKAQSAAALQQQKQQAQLSVVDSDNAARAYREVLRQTLQHELDSQTIQGTPNPAMMGGE